jgi:hypothetical protein
MDASWETPSRNLSAHHSSGSKRRKRAARPGRKARLAGTRFGATRKILSPAHRGESSLSPGGWRSAKVIGLMAALDIISIASAGKHLSLPHGCRKRLFFIGKRVKTARSKSSFGDDSFAVPLGPSDQCAIGLFLTGKLAEHLRPHAHPSPDVQQFESRNWIGVDRVGSPASVIFKCNDSKICDVVHKGFGLVRSTSRAYAVRATCG